MAKISLSFLIGFIIFSYSNSYAQNLAHLDIKCNEANASQGQRANADMMFRLVMGAIAEKRQERLAEGKELDFLFVARGRSSVAKNNLLIQDHLSFKKMQEKVYNDPAVQREARRQLGAGVPSRRIHTKQRMKMVMKEAFTKYFTDHERQDLLSFAHVGILYRIKEDESLEGDETSVKGDEISLMGVGDPIDNLPVWRFVHVLSPCNSDNSRVYDEGLARFFLDRPYEDEYRAWIIVPNDEIQRNLKQIINNTTLYDAENSDIDWTIKPPKYNLVASLNRVSEGNSNTFPLYALAMAIDGSLDGDYKFANKLVKEQGYKPSLVFLKGLYEIAIRPSPLRFFIPEAVKFRRKDHNYTEYYPMLEVNTALSLYDHMQKYGIVDEDFIVDLPAAMTLK